MTQLPPAISVILPIYNMAQYLSMALDSVTGQSLKNIEIICVDDCSTDDSPKIMSEAAAKDNRIKIMTMPNNSGAGPARNAGIKAAKGDYIAFLDPDDMLASEDVLEKLYNTAIINKVEVVGGNLQEFYDDSTNNAKDWGKGTFVKDGITDYADYPYAIGYTRFIYKRDMIIKNDFLFPPLRRYQDPVWFASIMTHVKKFYGMNMPVYLYRQTYDIISMTPDKLNHVLTGLAQNLNLFRIKNMPVHYKREQRELDYCLYRGFYYAIKNPFSDIPKLWNIYKNHAKKSPDVRLQLYHGYGVLRYGLTLIKKKLMHSRTKNYQINKTHFIAITKSTGGTKNTSTAIASAWAKGGYDVCVTSFLPGKIDDISGVKTHAVMESDFKNPSEFSRLKTVFLCFFSMLKWFIVVKPKRILVIGLPLSVPLMIISKLIWWRDCDIMILIDTHITVNLKYKRTQKISNTFKIMSKVTHNQFFYRYVMRHSKKVISLTDAMALDLINNYGLCDNKSIVIPPIIRNEFFEAEISNTRDKNKILFIGRLSVEKNVQDLIQSFAALSFKNNYLKLIIVGDGEERQQIETMVKSLNMSEYVEFAGFQSDTINYLKTAGCLVLCSHYEGFPLVFIEALAVGVPVVTYNFPAGPDTIIKNGKNGFIVPHYDVDGLADAIQKALQLKASPSDIRKSVMDFHPDIIHQRFIEVASKF